jgi:hypothetical protein
VPAQLALELRPLLAGAFELGRRARRERAGDDPVGPPAALRLDPEHAAHAPERAPGVLAPLAVDGEDRRRAEPHVVLVEVALDGRDEGLLALGPRERVPAAADRVASVRAERRRRGGDGDQPEGPHVALGRDVERAADLAERARRLGTPLAVDRQQPVAAAPFEVADEVALQRGDVRARALGVGERRPAGPLRGEALAQLALEAGAVAARERALGVGQRLGRAGDQPERADAALGREPEHPADVLERLLGVLVPLAVDREPLGGPEPLQVPVEVTLDGCDVRAMALGGAERDAAHDRRPWGGAGCFHASGRSGGSCSRNRPSARRARQPAGGVILATPRHRIALSWMRVAA